MNSEKNAEWEKQVSQDCAQYYIPFIKPQRKQN